MIEAMQWIKSNYFKFFQIITKEDCSVNSLSCLNSLKNLETLNLHSQSKVRKNGSRK